MFAAADAALVPTRANYVTQNLSSSALLPSPSISFSIFHLSYPGSMARGYNGGLGWKRKGGAVVMEREVMKAKIQNWKIDLFLWDSFLDCRRH